MVASRASLAPVMEQSRTCPCGFGQAGGLRLEPDPSLLPYRRGDGAGGGGGTWRQQQGVRGPWGGTLRAVPPPQRVDMHKEKVSRREIGSLTVSKRFPSYQKIVAPPSPPRLEPYYRKPLNFSVLDDIGHGIKVSPGLGGRPAGPRGLPWLSQSLVSPGLQGWVLGWAQTPPQWRRGVCALQPLRDSSCWGSAVPAWGWRGGTHGPIQQRETEARSTQQRPSVPPGPVLGRDALTPMLLFSAPTPPRRKAPVGGSAASQA